MNRYKNENKRFEIWKKYFKLGYEQMSYNLLHPNCWVYVDEAFASDFRHNATFTEDFPFLKNRSWAYTGYKNGYNYIEPFIHLSLQKFPNLDELWKDWYHPYFVKA